MGVVDMESPSVDSDTVPVKKGAVLVGFTDGNHGKNSKL